MFAIIKFNFFFQKDLYDIKPVPGILAFLVDVFDDKSNPNSKYESLKLIAF